MRGWEVARRRPGLIAWATMRLRWLFSSTSVRLRRLGFGFPGGRSFGEDEDELNVPRPGEVGEGGDAWRVAGEGGCGRMVCHCARLFWLLVE